MSSLITAYNYYLNSKFKSYGTNNDMTFSLLYPISLNGSIPSEFRCQIRSMVIPVSWNMINQYNNTTAFTLYRGSSSYSGTFSLTPANYNANSVQQEWIDRLRTAVITLDPTCNPTFTLSYSNDTNKFTFNLSVTDSTPTAVEFNNSAGYQVNLSMGFTTTWQILDGIPAQSQIGMNLSPSRALYVSSSTLIQNRSFEAITAPFANSNILESIPITTLPNTYQFYTAQDTATISVLSNQVIDTINIQLRDESLNRLLVDFDIDYSLHIQIQEHATYDSHTSKYGATKVPEPNSDEDILKELYRQQLLEERERTISELKKYRKLLSQEESKDNADDPI